MGHLAVPGNVVLYVSGGFMGGLKGLEPPPQTFAAPPPSICLEVSSIQSEVRLYLHSIEIFRHCRCRLCQPEAGLKISISQEHSMRSLSDWQA